MGVEIGDRIEVGPGHEIGFANKPQDAPVVYVEGMGGMTFTNGVVKLNLFQQFMNPEQGKIEGHFNLVLAIPAPIFLQIESILHQVVAELTPEQLSGTQPPESTNEKSE